MINCLKSILNYQLILEIYDDIEDEEDADGFISVKGSIGVFLYDKIDLSYDNDIDGILFGRKDYYIKQGDEA